MQLEKNINFKIIAVAPTRCFVGKQLRKELFMVKGI